MSRDHWSNLMFLEMIKTAIPVKDLTTVITIVKGHPSKCSRNVRESFNFAT